MNTTNTLTQCPTLEHMPTSQTFVEQHHQAIAHLHVFVAAVKNYIPGVAGANTTLQESMRPIDMPNQVNMQNAVEWATEQIQNEEKSLALALKKEAALLTLKNAERNRRDAERLAQRARKAWAALTVNPIIAVGSSKRTPNASSVIQYNVTV